MKKLIAILMLAVMCMSLVACGGGNTKKEKSIVGKWECAEENSVLEINEDKTGEIFVYGELLELTWLYDETSHLLVLTLVDGDMTEEATYMADDDVLYCDGWIYTRVAE